VGFLLCLVAALFDSLGLVWFAHHIERAENWLARIFLKLQLP
jgi:hypothetical protein